MTAHNLTFDQEQHVESHAPYITLFFVLLNYTAMEYIFAKWHGQRLLPFWLIGMALFLTLLTAIAASVFKLEFNRKWVYLTMVPAVVLGFTPFPLILGLMVLAITKATLVGLFFMHLKFEGNWVYYMLVPAGVLAVIMTLALYPDIAMQPSEQEQSSQEEDISSLEPSPLPRPSFS